MGIQESSLRPLRSANWQTEDWQKVFSVYAGGEKDSDLPSMLGNYSLVDNLIRFQPKFPLEPGVTYRAVFRPPRLPGNYPQEASIISAFRLPEAEREGTTVVTGIYPTAKVLPENLLKFYVHFSAPMRRGHIYDYIQLFDEAGKPVEMPFLEIDEELWNPDMTRLTLFIDPGRIKRGVQPLEEIGPVLEAGRSYTLVIDLGWRDAQGNSLKESYRKPFKAGPSQREPITLTTWKITPPPAGSVKALRIRFPNPLDHALAQRLIAVTDDAGHVLTGKKGLSEEECQWEFTPAKAWVAGPHHITVQTAIEDLAGNNIGKPFDVDLFETAQRRMSNTTISLDFEVKQ